MASLITGTGASAKGYTIQDIEQPASPGRLRRVSSHRNLPALMEESDEEGDAKAMLTPMEPPISPRRGHRRSESRDISAEQRKITRVALEGVMPTKETEEERMLRLNGSELERILMARLSNPSVEQILKDMKGKSKP